MSYIGIYRALYDHDPQAGVDTNGEAELAIKTGDLLYIVEKDADANWWKARKKAADEEEDEPEGLVPKTYIQEVCLSKYHLPQCRCRAQLDFISLSDQY
jgi:hypothetical protein